MSLSNKELLDNIKDEVAIEQGFRDWTSAIEYAYLPNLWPIVCERYASKKAKAIASKVADMQKEIEDNHDGDPWNNGAITTLEEVKKLFDQPIDKLFTRSEVQASCEATLKKASENAKLIELSPCTNFVCMKAIECDEPCEESEMKIDKSSITDPSNIVIL